MKNIFVLIFTFVFMYGCGSSTSRMAAKLDSSTPEQTYSSLPPVAKSIDMSFYSTATQEEAVYEEIIKEIYNESKSTRYYMSTHSYFNKISKTTQAKVQGLSTVIINNYAVIFQYKNGHITPSAIINDTTTKSEFPISIKIKERTLLPKDSNEDEDIYFYTVTVNIHETQKSLRGIPPYSYLDSDENLLADVENILSLVQSSSQEKNKQRMCVANNKRMETKKDLVKIRMDAKAEYYKSKGAFVLISRNKDYCAAPSKNFYYLDIMSNPDFKITGTITPKEIAYSDVNGIDNNADLSISRYTVKLRRLLQGLKMPLTFTSQDISFNIKQLNFNGYKLEAVISMENPNNFYIETKHISLYIGEKILIKDLSIKLPPQSKTIKDQTVIFESDSIDDYLNTFIENGETKTNLGISAQYMINDTTKSMFKEKTFHLVF